MKRSGLIPGAVAAVLAAFVGVGGTFAAPTKADEAMGGGTSAAATCASAPLKDVMAVYLEQPTPKSTPLPVPPGTSTYLAQALGARLGACRALPTADAARAAACTPVASESPPQLWTQLRICEALLNPPQAPAASDVIPWELPGVTSDQPVIFVIGAGADANMVSKLVSTLTVYLNEGRDFAGYHFTNDALLVPEPTWSAMTYATQCEQSPNVEGAIMLDITAAGGGASDEFVSRRNWSAIEATALFANCTHAAGASHGGRPAFIWSSDIAQQEGHKSTFTPLLPLSLLLTLASVYEEFSPLHSSAITTKRLYAAPKSPGPGGYTSEQDTANTTTVNAAQLGSVAGGFLASSITYTNSSAPLAQNPTVDQLTWNTLQSVAIKIVQNMNCWQASPQPIAGGAADVIGRSRQLPAYKPPPGLGQFKAGRPSAPFCAEPNGAQSVKILLPGPAGPTVSPAP